MNIRRHLYLTIAAVMATSCGDSSVQNQPNGSGRDGTVTYAESVLRNDNENLDVAGPEYSEPVPGLMPNVVYHYVNGDVSPVAQEVVVGSISDVTPGPAYAVSNGGDSQKEVDFNSSEALWRVIHVQVTINSEIDRAEGLPPPGPELTINLSIGPTDDFARVREGLISEPRSVFLLTHWPQDDLGFTVEIAAPQLSNVHDRARGAASSASHDRH